MAIINFDWLPAALRPQRRHLRPIQLFQLLLLSLSGIIIFALSIYQIFRGDQKNRGIVFIASAFYFIIIILCIREVYKGSHGNKWHFHGISAIVLLFILLPKWYYGVLYHEPGLNAFLVGIMCEFFAYIALNKIFSVVEENHVEGLVIEANKLALEVNEQI